MTDRARRLSRRSFLLGASAAGAATAAAIKAKPAGKAPAQGTQKGALRGYHASEHVNHYYRTAKI